MFGLQSYGLGTGYSFMGRVGHQLQFCGLGWAWVQYNLKYGFGLGSGWDLWVWVGCGLSSCRLGRVWVQLSSPCRTLLLTQAGTGTVHYWAVDNIDHNPSSAKAKDSFRGTSISLMQYPSHMNSELDSDVLVLGTGQHCKLWDSRFLHSNQPCYHDPPCTPSHTCNHPHTTQTGI